MNNALQLLEGNGMKVLNKSPLPVRVYSLGRDPRWGVQFYKDDIHPSINGIDVLSAIIKDPDINTELKIKN